MMRLFRSMALAESFRKRQCENDQKLLIKTTNSKFEYASGVIRERFEWRASEERKIKKLEWSESDYRAVWAERGNCCRSTPLMYYDSYEQKKMLLSGIGLKKKSAVRQSFRGRKKKNRWECVWIDLVLKTGDMSLSRRSTFKQDEHLRPEFMQSCCGG